MTISHTACECDEVACVCVYAIMYMLVIDDLTPDIDLTHRGLFQAFFLNWLGTYTIYIL